MMAVMVLPLPLPLLPLLVLLVLRLAMLLVLPGRASSSGRLATSRPPQPSTARSSAAATAGCQAPRPALLQPCLLLLGLVLLGPLSHHQGQSVAVCGQEQAGLLPLAPPRPRLLLAPPPAHRGCQPGGLEAPRVVWRVLQLRGWLQSRTNRRWCAQRASAAACAPHR